MEVLLAITGTQRFGEEEPEVTKLVTEGTLCRDGEIFLLSYAESELTGMEGTTTTFRIEQECVTLLRTGAVESRMVFAQGVEDRSLYDMGFGALMISVCADRVNVSIDENGGTLDVAYQITIEQETVGYIEYHIDARPKQAQ